MSVYEYYLYKQAKHCFRRSFFPNERTMSLSGHHDLKLITHAIKQET